MSTNPFGATYEAPDWLLAQLATGAVLWDTQGELLLVRVCRTCQCSISSCICSAPNSDAIPVWQAGQGVNERLVEYLKVKKEVHGAEKSVPSFRPHTAEEMNRRLTLWTPAKSVPSHHEAAVYMRKLFRGGDRVLVQLIHGTETGFKLDGVFYVSRDGENYRARDGQTLVVQKNEEEQLYVDVRGEQVFVSPRATTQEIPRSLEDATDEAFIHDLKMKNEDGWNVYITMNPVRQDSMSRKKEDIAAIYNAYAEVDEEGPECLKAMRASVTAGEIPEPSIILQSSEGKFQFVFFVEGFTGPQQEALNDGLAVKFKTDPASVDRSRVLRLPGFYNRKPQYNPSPLVTQIFESASVAAGVRYSPSDFKIETDIKSPTPVGQAAPPQLIRAICEEIQRSLVEANIDAEGKETGGDWAYKFKYECPNPLHTTTTRYREISVRKDGRVVGSHCYHTNCFGKNWLNWMMPWLEEVTGNEMHIPTPDTPLSSNGLEDIRKLVTMAIYRSSKERKASGWNIPLDGKEAANWASALIYSHLKTRGTFYFADSQGYLLLKDSKKLLAVSSEDPHFANLLAEYGIYPAQPEFMKLGGYIRMMAVVEGAKAPVSYSSHYNSRTRTFYFAESEGNLIRVSKDKIDRVPNGTDNELFVFPDPVEGEEPFRVNLNELPSVKRSLIPDEDSLLYKMYFDDLKLSFASSTLTAEGKRILLTVYVMLLMLAGITKNRPTLQIIGPTGCGKSTLLFLIGRLIVGSSFAVQSLPDSKSDFETTLINNALAFFDNVDSIPPSLYGLFCTASTGFNVKKRELFTTAKEINVPSKATLGLTSLVEQLVTSEQTNRSILFHMLKRKVSGYISDEILIKRFDSQRDLLAAEILVRGQMILQALDAQASYEPVVTTRLAGVGTLILRVARHEGWEPLAELLLNAWSREQLEGALRGGDLAEYLQKWMCKGDWKPADLHAGDLSNALRDGIMESTWRMETSWKGNAKALATLLKKSEESYAIRFGLTIRDDVANNSTLFCFHPTAAQLAFIRPTGWQPAEATQPIAQPINIDAPHPNLAPTPAVTAAAAVSKPEAGSEIKW